MRTDMQEWTEIRRKVLVEKMSKRAACREYNLGWGTLDKILRNTEPPGYSGADRRDKPKLGPYLEPPWVRWRLGLLVSKPG